jgi:hypothetical protein
MAKTLQMEKPGHVERYLIQICPIPNHFLAQ